MVEVVDGATGLHAAERSERPDDCTRQPPQPRIATNWNNAIAPWLPDSAARAISQLTHDSHSVAPAPGVLLFCGYTALTIVIAAVLLVRRDT